MVSDLAPVQASVGELCSVLVPSCDPYADLWTPFVTQFFGHWPDCPFPVYLGSNQASYEHPRIRMLHAGHGANWTNRVREQLEALDTPYVLLMLEDFFLRRPVDTAGVLRAFESLRELDGAVVRLVRRPAPDASVPGHPHLGEIDRGAPYRVSTQAAIWRRSALLDLMRAGESIWQFEILGSRRSDTVGPGFYGARRSLLTYDHHVVERGKWFRQEAAFFGSLQIGVDLTRRPIMTRREMLRWRLVKARSVLLDQIPWRTRQRLTGAVKRLMGRAQTPALERL